MIILLYIYIHAIQYLGYRIIIILIIHRTVLNKRAALRQQCFYIFIFITYLLRTILLNNILTIYFYSDMDLINNK